MRARSVSVVPTLPSLVQMVVWLGFTFGKNAGSPKWTGGALGGM